jgi:hypothetical protein
MKQILSAVLVMLIFAAGGERSYADEPKRPPFTAKFADLMLEISDRADLYQAANHSFGLKINICDWHAMERTPAGCEELSAPLVRRSGVLTYVKEPRKGTRFSLLLERPENASPPAPVPLLVVPNAQIDKRIGGTGEAYELSRIRTAESSQLLTTARGWPMVACSTHPLGTRYCTVGFLVKGAFVEAHWFAEDGVALNQAEVWAVASAVNSKLRSLAVTSR